MNDIDIANDWDNIIQYVAADNIDGNIASLKNASNTFFKWFRDNLFNGNANKCHLLVNAKGKVVLKGDFNIVILDVKFCCNLTFNRYISDLCKNADQKSCTC